MRSQRTVFRSALVLLAVTGVVACGTASAVVAAPDCRASSLQVSTGASNGAAGTVYTTLVVRNRGADACRLSGTPSAQPVWHSGGKVTNVGPLAKALVFPGRGGTAVLQPNARASVILGIAEAGNYPKASCSAAAINGVVVTFRHLTVRTRVTFTLPKTMACRKLASTEISGIALGTKSP